MSLASRTDEIAAYTSMKLAESLAKVLSDKQTAALLSEMRTYGRRCAEQFARELRKLKLEDRIMLMLKVAEQNS